MQPLETAVDNNVDNWLPLAVFTDKYPQFNLGQLRWLLRNRDHNGLDVAIRKIGKRIYIHDQLFADWLMKNR
jgi:hypothetical protein